MKLTITHFGNPAPRPLVLVHGLFGMGRNLAGIARKLAHSRYVISVDLRNHGDSPWADSHRYQDLADDLVETLAEFSDCDLMGHSMGGKAVMLYALQNPDRVRRLCVADIAPVTYDHSHSEYIDAMLALDLTNIQTRRDADEALRASIPNDGVRAFLLHGLRLDKAGKAWRNNLEILGAEMDEIIGWPESELSFDKPTMFLRGETSDYVADWTRPAIRKYFRDAHIVTLKNAGHWLHVEQPEAFLASLQAFFGIAA